MVSARIALTLGVFLLAGCATAPWDEDGRGSKPAQAEKQEYAGVVESVREVQVESPRAGIGGPAGAVVGGTVGSGVGRGRGAAAGAVIGTVVGGVAGEAAAQTGTQPGLEITVKLDEGRVIAVTQPAGEIFNPGDRVRVVSDGRSARVTR